MTAEYPGLDVAASGPQPPTAPNWPGTSTQPSPPVEVQTRPQPASQRRGAAAPRRSRRRHRRRRGTRTGLRRRGSGRRHQYRSGGRDDGPWLRRHPGLPAWHAPRHHRRSPRRSVRCLGASGGRRTRHRLRRRGTGRICDRATAWTLADPQPWPELTTTTGCLARQVGLRGPGAGPYSTSPRASTRGSGPGCPPVGGGAGFCASGLRSLRRTEIDSSTNASVGPDRPRVIVRGRGPRRSRSPLPGRRRRGNGRRRQRRGGVAVTQPSRSAEAGYSTAPSSANSAAPAGAR